MKIGDRIREARESKKMTQEELGRLVSTTKQTIFKYEAGIITNIPIDRIELIAKALNVSAAWLMGFANNPSAHTVANKSPMGEKIRDIRRKNRVVLSELATAASIPASRLNALELSRTEPTLEELGRLATALNVPVSVLASETELWRLSHPELVEKMRTVAETSNDIYEEDDFKIVFEDQLLTICEVFNENGQAAVLDRVAEMTEIQRYRKHRFDEPDF